MGMKDEIEKEEQIKLELADIEKQCKSWHDKGYKIMMVYQPITYGSVATDFYKSMLSCLSGEIWNYMADVHKVILKPYVSPHFPIDANRNMAVLDARERYKADYMFFMDTDQTFPPKTIPTLYESMLKMQETHNLHIMAGMYFAKKNPWGGVFGRYSPWDAKTEQWRAEYEKLGLIHPETGQQLLWWKSIDFWDPGQIFQVDVIGAGCMMMPIEVFEALEMPFFKYLPDFQKVGKQASEDMWFCAQLKKAGIPVFINSAVSCGHLSSYACDEALFVTQRDTFFRNAEKKSADETYSKMTDLRSEDTKRAWKNKNMGESLEDEHGRAD